MSDLTVNLPDELWCQVFGYVSSVSHKFKVAAVNRKFRRCILTVLATPMPLELHFIHIYSRDSDSLLNGCHVPLDKWPDAVKVLAEQTEFRRITFSDIPMSLDPVLLESVLKILIGADCLGQVTAFESNSWFFCHSDVVQTFIAKCAKLEVLKIKNCSMYEWWTATADNPLRPNLSLALKRKALTELSLELVDYDQAKTAQLFDALVPHKLRKVHLRAAVAQLLRLDLLGPTQLRSLGQSAWSAVEEIHLSFEPGHQPATRELFVALLTSLPLLRRCYISNGLKSDQFVPIVVSVLDHQRNLHTKLEILYDCHAVFPGCWVIDKVNQIQAHHPALHFDFGAGRLFDLKFELGNMSLCVKMSFREDGHCDHCFCFYPRVLHRLVALATYTGANAHVEDCQLDRCRVGRVAADLEGFKHLNDELEVTEVNEAHDLVTITLVSKKTGGQFHISIACGQCPINPCLGCLVIAD